MADFDKPIDIKVNPAPMLEKYAIIVIDRWVQALKRYNVGVTGALMESFIKELRKSNGDVDAVIFKFLKYGRFDDMGVGSGVSINGRVLNRRFDRYRDSDGKMQGHLARKKKPWYSKTLYREIAKLSDLLQKEYGQQVAGIIENSLSGALNLNI